MDHAPYLVCAFLNHGAEGTARIRDGNKTLRKVRSIQGKQIRLTAASELGRKNLLRLIESETKTLRRAGVAATAAAEQAASLVWLTNLTEADRVELKTVVDMWLAAGGDHRSWTESMLRAKLPVQQYRDYKSTTSADGIQQIFPLANGAAKGLMVQFLHHPESWRLGGPCPRCGKYYLRKKRNPQDYCSKECRMANTVTEPALEAREKIRKHKLELLEKGKTEWQRLNTREPWDVYAVRYADAIWRRESATAKWQATIRKSGIKESGGITKKFLTRWLNENRIQPPTESR